MQGITVWLNLISGNEGLNRIRRVLALQWARQTGMLLSKQRTALKSVGLTDVPTVLVYFDKETVDSPVSDIKVVTAPKQSHVIIFARDMQRKVTAYKPAYIRTEREGARALALAPQRNTRKKQYFSGRCVGSIQFQRFLHLRQLKSFLDIRFQFFRCQALYLP